MKRVLMIAVIAIAASTVATGQTKVAKETGNSTEAQIIALEKQGWEAAKNKDTSWFRNILLEDGMFVSSDGVANKSQVVQSLSSECRLRSYALDNFKFLMLDKNSALITFTAKQEAACGEKTIPSNVRASAVYVKRSGKWRLAFYTDTPVK